jgi:hypothetical protein
MLRRSLPDMPSRLTAVEDQLVGGDLRRVGQKAHGGEHRDRLAGAGFADDRQHFAGIDLHRHAIDGAEGAGRGLELDDEVFDFEKCHIRTSSVWDRAHHADRRPSG